SSVTAWMLAATSMCRCSNLVSGRRGGPPNRSWKCRLVMVRPSVVEVVHVHPETTVCLEFEQVLVDLVLVNRPAIGRQAHQLVFAVVDLETTVIGKGRVQ